MHSPSCVCTSCLHYAAYGSVDPALVTASLQTAGSLASGLIQLRRDKLAAQGVAVVTPPPPAAVPVVAAPAPTNTGSWGLALGALAVAGALTALVVWAARK